MSAGLTYPHVDKQDGDTARLRRLPRIRVAQIVMDYLGHGWSAEEMCRQHPHLTPAEAHAALAYYYDHQDEIAEEIRIECEQAEQERAQATRSPFYQRMRARGVL